MINKNEIAKKAYLLTAVLQYRLRKASLYFVEVF